MSPPAAKPVSDRSGTVSSLNISFVLFVLCLADLATGISFVQDVPYRLRASSRRRVVRNPGKRTTHHAPRASPHHEKTQSTHDHHGDGYQPPPAETPTEAFVPPHLNHFLSKTSFVA